MTPDATAGRQPDRILPGSTRPCGCYVRLPDYQAVMCAEHAAAREERRAAERERRQERAVAFEARVPWRGPGGRAFGPALLAGLFAVVFAVMWTEAAHEQRAFDEGFTTTSALVEDFRAGGRGAESVYDVTFRAADVRVHARLEDYAPPGPEVGDEIRVDYATSRPHIVRTTGYDSADDAVTCGTMALAAGVATAVLAGWWVVARRRAGPGPVPRCAPGRGPTTTG